MQGNCIKLIRFLDGSVTFKIPVYQRNYAWKKENCKRLLDDLNWLHDADKETHFLGSIVAQNTGYENYWIIDGQQRLTTVSLLLLAMVKRLEEREEPKLAKKVLNKYLIDDFESNDNKYRLHPIKHDFEDYKKLFQSSDNYAIRSNITENFEFFYNEIDKIRDLEDLFDSIGKLEIMALTLDKNDDAQLIFESINSTGLDLTDADKARNFLLMGESENRQKEFFECYWEPIEKKTDNNVTELLRNYLIVKTKKIPTSNRLYFTFKEYVEKNDVDRRELFKELLQFANHYEQIINARTGNQNIDYILRRMHYLGYTVQYPFLIAILNEISLGILNLSDFESSLLVGNL